MTELTALFFAVFAVVDSVIFAWQFWEIREQRKRQGKP